MAVPRRPAQISRIRSSESRFSLKDVPLFRFYELGRQHKDQSLVHIAYLRKPSLGEICYVHPRIKASGYCSYSLVSCDSVGLLGVIFYAYCKKTSVSANSLVIERTVQLAKQQEEVFKPLFTLERLDLLLYTSDCGSVVIIPTVLSDTSLLVQAK